MLLEEQSICQQDIYVSIIKEMFFFLKHLFLLMAVHNLKIYIYPSQNPLVESMCFIEEFGDYLPPEKWSLKKLENNDICFCFEFGPNGQDLTVTVTKYLYFSPLNSPLWFSLILNSCPKCNSSQRILIVHTLQLLIFKLQCIRNIFTIHQKYSMSVIQKQKILN